jgi:phosphatidylglycerophosphate synthase
MRKIPKEMENPIDNILINIADTTSPFHKNLGATPNILTTISLILTIISAIFIHLNYYKLAAIFYFISYYYDCMDGFFARKYNMVTEFGDYYDHITDALKILVIGGVVFYKIKSKIVGPTIFFGILWLIMNVHMGCQEEYYNSEKSKSLAILKNFCFGSPNEMMQYTKFFGVGTVQLLLTAFIWNLDRFQ